MHQGKGNPLEEGTVKRYVVQLRGDILAMAPWRNHETKRNTFGFVLFPVQICTEDSFLIRPQKLLFLGPETSFVVGPNTIFRPRDSQTM